MSQSINSHDFCTEAYFKTNESSSSSHDFVISKTIEDVTDPGILLDDVTDGVVGGRLQHKHNTITINAANRLNSSYTDDICDDTGNVDDDNDDDVVGESIDTTTGIIVQQSQNIPTIATLHPIGLSACSTSTSSGLDQFITHSMFVNIPMTSNSTTTTTTTMPSMIDYHQSPGLLFNSNNNNDNNNNNNTHAYIQIVKKQDSLTNTSHGSVTTTTAGSCTTNIDISSSNSSAIRIPPLLTTTPRPMKNTSSMTSSSLSQSNWRFLLRPIFEKILIEKLWTSGELGASNPYSLLLSMWFFISRYFGIGCRTDHAKLAYGNIIIERNTETGERYLRFTR
ncbi:unnamed protein product [Trichobilharzia regenti]|nr:unnamed protein product [Trichobilharzia regenti]